MISRKLKKKLISSLQTFPVVAVVGPRQSGKTTLVRNTFKDIEYRNLEAPDVRLFAENDPRAFLEPAYKGNGLIIDEAQKVPELFSYIQIVVDEHKEAKFVLTGSQNFLMYEKISQSLAGRIAILKLLPFSISELNKNQTFEKYSDYILHGFYPPIYDRNIPPVDWYQNYIQTYLERDVRQLKNISDLSAFTRFLKLCAGRTGQLLNITSLANDCGVAVNTAKSWLSILEASFVIHLLKPYHNNFNKRITKAPKLYFIDLGLVSSLLGLKDVSQVEQYHSIGSLFENFVFGEMLKDHFNRGEIPMLYYWRDKTGNEIDFIRETGNKTIIIEAKAGKTIHENFFSGFKLWNKVSNNKADHSYLIYGGESRQKRSIATILPWKDISLIR